jgi:aspartyl protease family protein
MAGRSAFMRGVFALAVVIPAASGSPARAAGAALTPFAGETVEEFEARKRGRRIEKSGVELGGVVTVPADRSGHFLVEPSVNGQRLRMIVDTGASVVALSYEDAASAGFRPAPGDFTVTVSTANGVAQAAPVRIDEIQIGDISVPCWSLPLPWASAGCGARHLPEPDRRVGEKLLPRLGLPTGRLQGHGNGRRDAHQQPLSLHPARHDPVPGA